MFRVYQRSDIDPLQINRMRDGSMISNIQLMRDGKAPFTGAGKRVIIHHEFQDVRGLWIEVIEDTHKSFLHNQFGINQSHPTHPVIRSEFNKVRKEYWRERAKEFK